MDVTHTPCQFSPNCILETHTQDGVVVEAVRGQTLEWLKRLELNGGELTQQDLDDLHLSQHFEAEGPTAALSMVVSLAVSMATAGTGMSLGMTVAGVTPAATATVAQAFVMGAVQATFTGVCSSAAVALLTHNGHVGKAVQDLVRQENLKSLGISAVIQGTTMGLSKMMGTPSSTLAANQQAKTLAEQAAKEAGFTVPSLAQRLTAGIQSHFQHQAVKTAVSMAVNMGVGKEPEDVVRRGIKGCLAGVMGAVVANRLSEAMSCEGQEPLNPILHKVLHGGLGAGMGALVEGEKGAKAGAIGALVAETVADLISEEREVLGQRVLEKAEAQGMDIENDEDRLADLILEETHSTLDVARLSGVLAALLTNQDVMTAEMTATNAVENNWTRFVIEGIRAGFKAGGSFLKKAGQQSAQKALKKETIEAAKQNLKKQPSKSILKKEAAEGAKEGGKKGVKFTEEAKKAGLEKPKLKPRSKQTGNQGKDSPKNVANHEKYKDQLRQEQGASNQAEAAARQLEQLKTERGDIIAGLGSKGDVKVKDEPRLIAKYGGKPGDWIKVTSKAVKTDKGIMQTHAYRNVKTGEIVEPKLKFEGGN